MSDFELGASFDEQRLFRNDFSVRVKREKVAALIAEMQQLLADPTCIGFEIEMRNFSLTLKPSIFKDGYAEF